MLIVFAVVVTALATAFGLALLRTLGLDQVLVVLVLALLVGAGVVVLDLPPLRLPLLVADLPAREPREPVGGVLQPAAHLEQGSGPLAARGAEELASLEHRVMVDVTPQELADRSGEFAEARQTLPALTRTRADAGARWQRLDTEYNDAVREQVHTRTAYEQAQHRLQVGDQRAEQQNRDWSGRLSELRTRTAASRQQRARFPARWIRPDQVAALRSRFGSATQARLRSEAVEAELAQGHWETDASVEEKLTLMNAAVLTQDEQLAQRVRCALIVSAV
mgnify:CR=1 FL=1